MTKSKNATSETALLRDILHFSDDDLNLNSTGRLSVDQEKSIKDQYNRLLRKIALSAFVILAIPVCIILYFLLTFGWFYFDISVLGYLLIFWVITYRIGWLPLTKNLRHLLKIRDDMNEGFVEQVRGLAVVDPQKYTVTINNEKIPVSREVALRMRHLDPYAVYFLPRSKIVLSAENLTEAEQPIQEQERASQFEYDHRHLQVLDDDRFGDFLSESRR